MQAPQLLTEADYTAAITQPQFLLFKHSPRCGTSLEASLQYERFVASSDVPTAWVDVVAQRELARWIAEQCGVVHQSPQAILFRDGRVVWNASHLSVTYDALGNACAPATKA